MSAGLISLGAGVFIGLLYALLKVRSPAPPAIALVGLLGMLLGEQLVTAIVQDNDARTTLSHQEASSGMAADKDSAVVTRPTRAG